MEIIEKDKQQGFGHRKEEITLDELRALDSFKDYNEEQAKNLIYTMKTFARILYHILAEEQRNLGNSREIGMNIAVPISVNKAA